MRLHSCLRLCLRLALSLLRSEKGNVIFMVAAAGFLLVTAVGAAIDMSRAQTLQARVTAALDAAGLAAAAQCAGSSAPATCMQATAQRYFNANMPAGYMQSGSATISTNYDASTGVTTLSTSISQQTTFLGAVGINSVTTTATSQVTATSSGLEIALVLDNSGSMGASVTSGGSIAKILALKCALAGEAAVGPGIDLWGPYDGSGTTGGSNCASRVSSNAATGLIDIIFGANTSLSNVYVSVVPFMGMVSLNATNATQAGWVSNPNGYDFGPAYSTVAAGSCPVYSGVTGTYTAGTPTTFSAYGGTWTLNIGGPHCSYTLAGTATPNFGLANWTGGIVARSTIASDPNDMSETSTPTAGKIPVYYQSSDPVNLPANLWQTSSASGGNTTTVYDYSTVILPESSPPTPNPGAYYVQPHAKSPDFRPPAPISADLQSKAAIVSAITSMVPSGATALNVGLAWGWRTLSPSWQGLWGTSGVPLNYGQAGNQKILILMTDGMNFEGNGLAADTTLDQQTAQVCDSIKAQGITIYTVGFGALMTGSGSSPVATAYPFYPSEAQRESNNPVYVDDPLLQYCSTNNNNGQTCSTTGPYCFVTTTNVDLVNAFHQIGNKITNLRISK